MWKIRAALFSLLAIVLLASGGYYSQNSMNVVQKPKTKTEKDKQKAIYRMFTPNDAIKAAKLDTQLLLSQERGDILPFTRWVWKADNTSQWHKENSLTLNYVSRATTAIIPLPVSGGYLSRIDLRLFAPQEQDLQDWIENWEQLQFDPHFSRFITGDTIRNVTRANPPKKVRQSKKEWVKEACKPYTADDGKIYDYNWVQMEVETVEQVKTEEIVVARENSHAIDAKTFLDLQVLVSSQAPVVSYGYLSSRLLSTIKNKGIFTTVYGGLYYEFAGIRKNKTGKGTDLDLFLEDLGVGNINQGLDFRKVFNKLTSDKKIAVFRSKVTGKPRAVVWFNTLSHTPGGIVFITFDIKNENIDVNKHAMFNLIDFTPDAYEVIAIQANGLQRYALFNGNGDLLDQADSENVVADHTVPAPFTPNLQAAISCIRCHGPEDGWQPLRNDAKDILSSYVDIFGDTTDVKQTIPDVINRLRGLYSGSPYESLTRARNDYAKAVLESTTSSKWKGDVELEKVIKINSERLSRTWSEERYDQVDAAYALKDLGFKVDIGKEVNWFRILIPPDKRAVVKGTGIIPEDIRIAALRRGTYINRNDWDFCRDFAAERAETTWKKLQKGLPK